MVYDAKNGVFFSPYLKYMSWTNKGLVFFWMGVVVANSIKRMAQ
jgi:hypothetical protein